MAEVIKTFDSGYAYSAYHKPTDETWYIIGINERRGRACAAGYPPSIGDLSDFENFERLDPLTAEELSHRYAKFGNDWD